MIVKDPCGNTWASRGFLMLRKCWVLWMLASLVLMAGLQRYSVAPAALLALILLLRAARIAPDARTAWLGTFLAYAVAQLVVLDNAYFQAPTTVRVAIDVGTSLLLALPVLLHRALLPRLPDALVWLPFACAQVLPEWLFAQGPYGSWGTLAYSFAGVGALLQWLAFGGTRVRSGRCQRRSHKRAPLVLGVLLPA